MRYVKTLQNVNVYMLKVINDLMSNNIVFIDFKRTIIIL